MPFDFLRPKPRPQRGETTPADPQRGGATPDLRGASYEDGEAALTPQRPAAQSTVAPSIAAIRGGAIIEPGMSGPAVGAVQDLLTRLGFGVARTETYGPTTQGLLTSFQALYGVQQTGRVGPTTLAVLEKAAQASVTYEQLVEILPNADAAFLKANLSHLNQSMYKGEMTTLERKATYIAQIAHESDRFRGLTEYASGRAYNGRRDLGNTEPGDGPRYKGRGAIHLTGRANYEAASKHFGVDFVADPALAAEPEWAFKIAEWYWTTRDLNKYADNGQFTTQTKRINGGTNGLADRKAVLARARKVLAR